ncbi:hypothetical protein Pmani_025442 [Petrolisthes manimaculis]|uniref:C2H2-type domain-containing protein n=1 Tax=Petrolisthes manimaculis TaxID=1843537 RepID=A0AAE1P7Y8_9EUCA|nr:hypothetical protein Pmani_025442 [Petrolisthes manimaculis]
MTSCSNRNVMNNVVKEETRGHLLSLQSLDNTPALPLTTPQVTLGGREAPIVTLSENEVGGESLLLCSVKQEDAGRPPIGARNTTPSQHLASEATITYATLNTLDSSVNIVLQPLEEDTVAHSSSSCNTQHLQNSPSKADRSVQDMAGGQLVLVGEPGSGEAMTYIYIHQGKTENQRPDEGEVEEIEGESHTITFNSADGSTLHTLPAAYTQQLQHTYGDLVLVGTTDEEGPSALGDDEALANTSGKQDDQVLLLSMGPLKLEEEGSRSRLTDEIREKSEPGSKEGNGQSQQQEESEGSSTIEERLATRDSLLPPRRNRRCGDPGQLTCPVCHTQFRSVRQYHGHLQVHRGQGVWSCEICHHSCQSAAELRVHKTEAHNAPRPFPCPSCHLSFSKSLVLEDHVRSVHKKERPLACTFCTKAFYRPHDLKMHLNLHLGIKTNVCHVCGRQFSHPSNLIRHQRLHTGIKPYVCATCGKRFKQLTLLHKHRATHQPTFGVCPLCPATFRSASGLRKHSKLEHKKVITLQEAARIIRGQTGGSGRSYYCQVCGAQFSLKSELKDHEQQAHASTSQYLCASCGKVYPMADVKTHACFTPEEQANDPLGLHSVQAVVESVTSDLDINSATPTVATHTTTDQQDGHAVSVVEKGDEGDEEEDYLVMYITQEGESVSYVMKKGSKISRDQVLQVDAPGNNLTQEDATNAFRPTLPEETIMINVHSQHQDDQTLLLASQSDDNGNPSSTMPDTSLPSAPLPIHSIKLEPQSSGDIMMDTGDTTQLTDKSLMPIITLTTPSTKNEVESKSISLPLKAMNKPLILKQERDVPEDEELEVKPDISNNKRGTTGQLLCPNCNKTFSKPWNFQQHMATHDASLHRYRCSECGLSFAYRSTLNRHIEKHNPRKTMHQCPECPKRYMSVTSMKQHHKRDHQQLRPYACKLCSKRFFSKSDFKYHMRLHKKEQPYMCFACGREFSHVSHLHRHERVHTGERPHRCPKCPRAFIQYMNLKIHLKKHEKMETEVVVPKSKLTTSNNMVMEGSDVNDSGNIMNCNDPELEGHILVGPSLEGPSLVGSSLEEHSPEGHNVVSKSTQSLDVHSANPSIDLGNAEAVPDLPRDQLPAGTIILSESDLASAQHAGQFSGGHTAVMTGMDGECIAIFVQDGIN